jgi:hypothetical protein
MSVRHGDGGNPADDDYLLSSQVKIRLIARVAAVKICQVAL